ncbi:MAG: histidine phosphatase family protein [Pseudomonadota bacterium]
MSHITLIRHGQANSHAKDEASYDQLSPLGHQQAAWLGEHMRATHQHHTRLYTGTLRRHAETALAMQTGLTPTVDPRLNELEYFTMANALEAEHGIKAPSEPAEFVHHFPIVLAHWRDDRIEGAPERFSCFEARITDVLIEIGQGTGPALVVTSGGLIAMTMRVHLGLDIPAMANVALAIMNTSMHRLHPIGGQWSPVMFNAVPHLEAPDRHHAQTHV